MSHDGIKPFFFCMYTKMISQLIQFVFLAVLGASMVDAKWLSTIPNAPVRGLSKVFGIPTWISHVEGILIS